MGFGQFDSICVKAPLPLCALVGPPSPISGATGIISNCYARNIEVANTIIFEGAASFMHIVALGMTVIMILHIRSKFTAVGSWAPSGDRRNSSLTSPIRRPQGNHHILLPLPSSHNLFPRHRCRRRPSRKRTVPVLRRSTGRTDLSVMHLPTRQRIRGLPAIRRWHRSIRLVDPDHLRSNIRHDLRDLHFDLQVMGRTRT